jgi:hypothetical protein
MLWGGVGFGLLMRQKGANLSLQAVGVLVFSLFPKVWAHWGAGHLGLLYAVQWTPWLVMTLQRKSGCWYWQPGLFMALIFLADPRWAVYCGLFWLAWVLFLENDGWLERVRRMLVQGLLAIGLSAPLWLPMSDFVAHSTRASLQPNEALVFSLSPAQWIGLIFPFPNANHEVQIYLGWVVILLAITSILFNRDRTTLFWAGVIVVSALVSLGSYLPGLSYLYRLPPFSLLRVPARGMLLGGFASLVLAMQGLQSLLTIDLTGWKRPGRLSLLGLSASSWAIALGLWILAGSTPLAFVWGAIGVSAAWLVLELRWAGGLDARQMVVVIAILLLLDLGGIDRQIFRYRPAKEVLSEGAAAAAWLASQPDIADTKVYSPTYSIPQQTGAYYGLSRADGVDPLQLAAYVSRLDAASVIPHEEYSVVLPPLEENPEAGWLPDLDKLGAMQVGYIASASPMAIDGELVFQTDEVTIYKVPSVEKTDLIDLELYPQSILLGLLLAGVTISVWVIRKKVPWEDKQQVWLLGFAFFVSLLLLAPYLVAWFRSSADWVFSGILINAADSFGYLAVMRRGLGGEWWFTSPYSTLHQIRAWILLPYLWLGKLAVFLPLEPYPSLVVLYHGARTIGIAAGVIASYRFISLFVKNIFLRRLGTALAVFGGGLGWVLVLAGKPGAFGDLPLDFFSPEAFGLLSYAAFPHLVWSRALFLMVLTSFLKNMNDPENNCIPWKTSLVWLSLVLFQPLTGGLAFLIVVVNLVILRLQAKGMPGYLKAEFRFLIVSGSLAAIAVLVIAFQLLTDPYLKAWNAQNLHPTPHLIHLIVAYGLTGVLAFWGIKKLSSADLPKTGFALGWLTIVAFGIYLPAFFQRRVLEGIWVLLVVLALVWLESKPKRTLTLSWAAVSMLSGLFLVIGLFTASRQPADPAYFSSTEYADFLLLDEELEDDAVILSTFETGKRLAAFAFARMVTGHSTETVPFMDLNREVNAYFSGELGVSEAKNLFEQHGVDYVLWGPREMSLGGEFPENCNQGFLSYVLCPLTQ